MQTRTITLLFIFIALAIAQTIVIFTVDSRKCIGCRQCVAVCQYDAIEIIGGKAVIDPEKCHGNGDCARVCPTRAISPIAAIAQFDDSLDSLDSLDSPISNDSSFKQLDLSSEPESIATKNSIRQPEKSDSLSGERKSTAIVDAKKCIGCGFCVRACPERAITIIDGKAVIDAAKCKAHGKCILRCPTKAIQIK